MDIFVNLRAIIKSIPCQLIIVLMGSLFFSKYLPHSILSFLYALSLSIKTILIFLLPLIIGGLTFSSFSKLTGGYIFFPVILLGIVCLSNYCAVLLSYGVGIQLQSFIAVSQIIKVPSELLPQFIFPSIKLCENWMGLLFGISLGLYTSFAKNRRLTQLAESCLKIVTLFLNRIFIPILPLFILGFVIKLQHDGILIELFKNFAPLCSIIVAIQWGYLVFAYFCANGCSLKLTGQALKNIFPACLVGFSTMSSAAALPVLVAGASRNTKNESLAQSVIPSVINTHMLGDALAIPLMAFSLMKGLPSLDIYLSFALAYTMTKFAAAGVPGGTILVMIPVLESYLHFTPEMSGLILMMYVLFDPLCTMANILGNGLFPLVFERIWKWRLA